VKAGGKDLLRYCELFFFYPEGNFVIENVSEEPGKICDCSFLAVLV
jgi:hypothetical protein